MSFMAGIKCPKNGHACINFACQNGSAINCQWQEIRTSDRTEMSDDKDPVLAQIESDARKAVKEYPSALSLMYEAGAYNQDPIAWNRCIDAVKPLISNMVQSQIESAMDVRTIQSTWENLAIELEKMHIPQNE